MKTSDKLWEHFESVLAQRAPELLAALLPPATANEIEATEAELSFKFPSDLRAAYLRHNGSSPDDSYPGFFVKGRTHWFSLSEMKDYWAASRQLALEIWPDNCDSAPEAGKNQHKVRGDAWNVGRIPVAKVNGSDHFFVDLLPGATGTVGQLVRDMEMWGDCTDESVVATSFDAYVALFTERLEQGLISYDPVKTWVNQRGQEIGDWATLSG
jgi:cell wall assembly regulator SMI1